MHVYFVLLKKLNRTFTFLYVSIIWKPKDRLMTSSSLGLVTMLVTDSVTDWLRYTKFKGGGGINIQIQRVGYFIPSE